MTFCNTDLGKMFNKLQNIIVKYYWCVKLKKRRKEMKQLDFSKITFEDALAQLENIVRELEAGKIKLDDAVEAYEKATALKNFCEEKLKNAQLKIEKINLSPEGHISTEPFDKIEEN